MATDNAEPLWCSHCGEPIPAASRACEKCGTPIATPSPGAEGAGGTSYHRLRVGDVLDAKWRLESKLGAGGMGAVFLAHDLTLDRKVAVKVLAGQLCSDDEFMLRFEREARMTAKLEHPNIVPVFAVGRHFGRPFIVMKALQGMTLARLVTQRAAENRRLSRDEVLGIFRQLCAGLGFIHQKGYVHRDIKAGNVFVSTDWLVTLLDFGVLRDTSARSITKTGALLGTPHYISPEQAMGVRGIDGRSDLYSVGILMYECITLRPPFSGDPLALMRAHTETPPPDLTTITPDVPKAVAQVVQKALAKKPVDRYPTAAELFAALEAAWPAGAPAAAPNPDLTKTAPAGARIPAGLDAGPAATAAPELSPLRPSEPPPAASPFPSKPLPPQKTEPILPVSAEVRDSAKGVVSGRQTAPRDTNATVVGPAPSDPNATKVGPLPTGPERPQALDPNATAVGPLPTAPDKPSDPNATKVGPAPTASELAALKAETRVAPLPTPSEQSEAKAGEAASPGAVPEVSRTSLTDSTVRAKVTTADEAAKPLIELQPADEAGPADPPKPAEAPKPDQAPTELKISEVTTTPPKATGAKRPDAASPSQPPVEREFFAKPGPGRATWDRLNAVGGRKRLPLFAAGAGAAALLLVFGGYQLFKSPTDAVPDRPAKPVVDAPADPKPPEVATPKPEDPKPADPTPDPVPDSILDPIAKAPDKATDPKLPDGDTFPTLSFEDPPAKPEPKKHVRRDPPRGDPRKPDSLAKLEPKKVQPKPDPVVRPEPRKPDPVVATVAPKSTTGQVRVVTTLSGNPYWAMVSVDGQSKGETPLTIDLAPGKHKVKIERSGFKTVEKEVTVTAGAKPVVLGVELKP